MPNWVWNGIFIGGALGLLISGVRHSIWSYRIAHRPLDLDRFARAWKHATEHAGHTVIDGEVTRSEVEYLD